RRPHRPLPLPGQPRRRLRPARPVRLGRHLRPAPFLRRLSVHQPGQHRALEPKPLRGQLPDAHADPAPRAGLPRAGHPGARAVRRAHGQGRPRAAGLLPRRAPLDPEGPELPALVRRSARLAGEVPQVIGAVVGFFVAAMIGLTGVGGGTLTVPILILFLGVPAAEAVGTALVFSALVKIPACLVYLRERHVDFRVLRYLLLGGVPGVILGSLTLGRLVDAGLKNTVLAVVGVTIAATAFVNLARLISAQGERTESQASRTALLPFLTFPIGLEVGFSSAGAGALGTLLLLYCTPLAASPVVGTDLAFGMILPAGGGGLHLSLGDWQPTLFWKMVAGGVPGALLGARLATVLPARVLRAALLLWLVYLGSQLLYRSLHAAGGAGENPRPAWAVVSSAPRGAGPPGPPRRGPA